MVLMGRVKHSKVPKIEILQCLYNISKKKLKMKLIFLGPHKYQSFLNVYFNTLGPKFSTRLILSLLMGMIKHSQITQYNKFEISLQYLKKEVRNGGHFWYAAKLRSFHKFVLSFLMEVTRHVENTQNRTVVIFLQYMKKNCCNCFVFYCDEKHSDILRWPSHVRCYFFYYSA